MFNIFVRKSWLILLALSALVLVVMPMSHGAKAQELAPDLGYIEWTRPGFRENGDILEPEEIGGYEARYLSGGEPRTAVIPDGSITRYDLSRLQPLPDPGQATIDLLVYDTNGLYSRAAAIPVVIPKTSPPVSPGSPVYVPPPKFDPAARCNTDVFCWLDSLNTLNGTE